MADVMTFPKSVDEFMEQYKIIDSDHVYTNGAEFVPVFRMRQWFEHLDIAPKTNADRIRAMSDEKLAAFICSLLIDRNIEVTSEAWLDWLRQEAKE